METAPLNSDLALGPSGGQAAWVRTDDNIKLRVAHWPGGSKGTVFMLPGRTEYIEKYGITASGMAAHGYSSVTLDWRGQGLSDRLLADATLGHVGTFWDYQRDLFALIEYVDTLNLPKPYYMIAHSMGGCIGLRALHFHGQLFHAAAFSGPMWGIHTSALLRPVLLVLPRLASFFGFGRTPVPGTNRHAYVLTTPFEGNSLTSNEAAWDLMKQQTEAMPDVQLGAPTMHWVAQAQNEIARLQKLGPAKHPMITHVGSDEQVTDFKKINRIAKRWRNGSLHIVEGARHEIVIETPAVRNHFFAQAAELFDANKRLTWA